MFLVLLTPRAPISDMFIYFYDLAQARLYCMDMNGIEGFQYAPRNPSIPPGITNLWEYFTPGCPISNNLSNI